MQRENCPYANSSTIKPTWTDLGSNTGLRDEIPANSRLRLGTAVARIPFYLKSICRFYEKAEGLFCT
jgi:hypothetical protein